METIQVNTTQRNSVSGYIQLFSSMDDKKSTTHITDSHIPATILHYEWQKPL